MILRMLSLLMPGSSLATFLPVVVQDAINIKAPTVGSQVLMIESTNRVSAYVLRARSSLSLLWLVHRVRDHP